MLRPSSVEVALEHSKSGAVQVNAVCEELLDFEVLQGPCPEDQELLQKKLKEVVLESLASLYRRPGPGVG